MENSIFLTTFPSTLPEENSDRISSAPNSGDGRIWLIPPNSNSAFLTSVRYRGKNCFSGVGSPSYVFLASGIRAPRVCRMTCLKDCHIKFLNFFAFFVWQSWVSSAYPVFRHLLPLLGKPEGLSVKKNSFLPWCFINSKENLKQWSWAEYISSIPRRQGAREIHRMFSFQAIWMEKPP